MIGKREPTQFSFLNPAPPDSGVRVDRFLQRVDELIDFEPVREMVAPYFAAIGRPSIDPVLMVKMMVVGFLLGIGSDRRLVEECADRISVRRFLGLGLTDPVPAHSSFTHWRQRLGPELFRALLHMIVVQCQAHGMTLSGDRTVDGTAVKAQADRHGPVVVVPEGWDVDEYLRQLGVHDPPPDDDQLPDDADTPDDAHRADNSAANNAPPDEGHTGGKGTLINTHDPDARMSRRFRADRPEFRYYASLCADAHNGLITDATAHAREWAATAAEHVDHDPGQVKRLAADGLYDHGAALAELHQRGVEPHVPETAHYRHGQLSRDEFCYDAERDVYICPEGAVLGKSRERADTGQSYYVARISDCRACPRKAQCTSAQRRTVSRQQYQWARERAVRDGPAYEQLQRRRRVNEHLNLLGKRDHGLGRARGLGLAAMRIQAALTGVAINLGKLVRYVDDRRGGHAGGCATALAGLFTHTWRHLQRALVALDRLRAHLLTHLIGLPTPSHSSRAAAGRAF